MTTGNQSLRRLGTMIAYGFPEVDLDAELVLARSLGASVVEIFPLWQTEPDPRLVGAKVCDAGLAVHSAHGCWGGQSIRAPRVDLGSLEPEARGQSVDDLRRCVDWLAVAGGTHLVVHPGGLSDPEQWNDRRQALGESLLALAEHARPTGILLCVENMPPGVFPGSRMSDLRDLLDELEQPELALALDTGHANITSSAARETLDAEGWLGTTHVHDNDGRQDTHLPPGFGSVDWRAWTQALDAIGYDGPVMLECVRYIRRNPEVCDDAMRERLRSLCSGRAGYAD